MVDFKAKREERRRIVEQLAQHAVEITEEHIENIPVDALEECLALLHKRGVPIIGIKGVDIDPNFPYAASAIKRMQDKLSLRDFIFEPPHKMLMNSGYRQLWRDMYPGVLSFKYFEGLRCSNAHLIIGNRHFYADHSSMLVNFVDGRRVTAFNPPDAKRRLHIYGQCTVAGFWVSDEQTFPSRLQKHLIKAGMGDLSVENHGIEGVDPSVHIVNFILDSPTFGEGDLVMLYEFNPFAIEILERAGLSFFDVQALWPINSTTRRCFDNHPAHMGPRGYKLLADIVSKELVRTQLAGTYSPKREIESFATYKTYLTSANIWKGNLVMEQYLASVRQRIPAQLADTKKRGAIVMNANPFTLGHRHLVEYASSQVDLLFVFCASADTSFFSTEDRLEMVRRGTEDLGNVVVSSSGRAFANTETFPEYHIQELDFDKSDVGSKDIFIFSHFIAPNLGITKRFIGQEKPGSLTKSFNEHMKRALPKQGIEVEEIDRFEVDKEAVSASKVRSCLEAGDLEGLRPLVPQSTYDYLMQMRSEGRV